MLYKMYYTWYDDVARETRHTVETFYAENDTEAISHAEFTIGHIVGTIKRIYNTSTNKRIR